VQAPRIALLASLFAGSPGVASEDGDTRPAAGERPAAIQIPGT